MAARAPHPRSSASVASSGASPLGFGVCCITAGTAILDPIPDPAFPVWQATLAADRAMIADRIPRRLSTARLTETPEALWESMQAPSDPCT